MKEYKYHKPLPYRDDVWLYLMLEDVAREIRASNGGKDSVDEMKILEAMTVVWENMTDCDRLVDVLDEIERGV